MFVTVSITDTLLLAEFTTYIFVPSGLTAIPLGFIPASIVSVTLFVAVSITEILLLPMFATYTFVPSGATATPKGSLPTSTTAITVLFTVSITETLLLPPFVIYANGAELEEGVSFISIDMDSGFVLIST